MTTDNDIYDPLGIEIFAIDETFESMFNALKGVYARLHFKELYVLKLLGIKKMKTLFWLNPKRSTSLKGLLNTMTGWQNGKRLSSIHPN
jgi:hypothetical protein